MRYDLEYAFCVRMQVEFGEHWAELEYATDSMLPFVPIAGMAIVLEEELNAVEFVIYKVTWRVIHDSFVLDVTSEYLENFNSVYEVVDYFCNEPFGWKVVSESSHFEAVAKEEADKR